MQIATSTSVPHAAASGAQHFSPVAADSGTNPLAHYQIIRRNGAVVPFEPNKIAIAMMKAFLAVHGTQGAASASVRETVDGLTQAVIRALEKSKQMLIHDHIDHHIGEITGPVSPEVQRKLAAFREITKYL